MTRTRHAPSGGNLPTLSMAVIAVCVAIGASPAARAQERTPANRPQISDQAAAAVAQLSRTLAAAQVSFTARTIQVYLNEAGQPLHIFHTLKVVMRRPDRLAVAVAGDDGSHDVFYDGKSVTIVAPDTKVYAVVAAPADIPSAVGEVTEKFNVDLPLTNFFAARPDQSLLRGVVAGWDVGTARIGGIECRHLFFHHADGTDLELWVEPNEGAIPHRLVVTYRSLPGQPIFIAEFTNWDSRTRPSDAAFAFQPPAEAKRIELAPPVAPGK